MTTMLRQVHQHNSEMSMIRDSANANASMEFEVSRLKQQLEKSRKDNEDLKDRLFSGSFEDSQSTADDKQKMLLMRAQRDLVS